VGDVKVAAATILAGMLAVLREERHQFDRQVVNRVSIGIASHEIQAMIVAGG